MNIEKSNKLFISNNDHSFSSLINNKWYVYFITDIVYDRPAIVYFDTNDLLTSDQQIRLK